MGKGNPGSYGLLAWIKAPSTALFGRQRSTCISFLWADGTRIDIDCLGVKEIDLGKRKSLWGVWE